MNGHLQGVQGTSRIAVCNGLQLADGTRVELDAKLSRRGSPHEGLDVDLGQRPQDIDTRPGQQGGVDLERGILGRRADEGDRAAFDVGQEGILLGFVEAMHFVDEQHGPPPGERLGLRDRLAHIAHAREHGGEASPFGTRCVREQSRQRGLAGARRSPKDHRVDDAVIGQFAQGPSFVEEVLLTHEVGQAARAHAIRQRSAGRQFQLRVKG